MFVVSSSAFKILYIAAYPPKYIYLLFMYHSGLPYRKQRLFANMYLFNNKVTYYILQLFLYGNCHKLAVLIIPKLSRLPCMCLN